MTAPSDEVAIDWKRDGDDITVNATLGEASITIKGDLEDDALATLVNSTAAIMNAVVDNINSEEDS